MTTYSCTNPECRWRGEDKPWRCFTAESLGFVGVCPKCRCLVEDLDLLKRVAMREIDGEMPISE
jgi:hypothetical protein